MDQQLLRKLQSANSEERRGAILILAQSGDPRAITILKHVHETDTDPALRELSKKAAQHLWQTINDTKQPVSPPEKKQTDTFQSPVHANKHTNNDPAVIPQAARVYLDRALSLHIAADTNNALKMLIQAIDLYPACVNDRVTANLASELTGFPPEEALRKLRDKSQRENIVSTTRKASRKPQKQRRPLTLILLITALAALSIVTIYFMQTGYLDNYFAVLRSYNWKRHKHVVVGTEYYLIPPRGNPPDNGWPVVVGLHGYGGNGGHMLHHASTFTSQGAIFISPTFGKYEPMPGAGPIAPMKQILDDSNLQHPIDPRRVVLLGFSQGGDFAYRFSIYYPELIAGVVTAGAPSLDAGTPARADLPYVFTWGKSDGLQNHVLPDIVYPLINRGYNVKYAVIEGAGHEVTPYALESVLQMLGLQE